MRSARRVSNPLGVASGSLLLPTAGGVRVHWIGFSGRQHGPVQYCAMAAARLTMSDLLSPDRFELLYRSGFGSCSWPGRSSSGRGRMSRRAALKCPFSGAGTSSPVVAASGPGRARARVQFLLAPPPSAAGQSERRDGAAEKFKVSGEDQSGRIRGRSTKQK